MSALYKRQGFQECGWCIKALTPALSQREKQQGFTLTEISIVILIISFLTAAVLKGQNLINEAKLQSIVKEVSNIQVAANSFYAKYGCSSSACSVAGYPGDFNQGVAFWGSSSKDGDNNGRIEFINTATTPVYEGYVAWQHLAFAGMLTTPYLGTATTSAPVPGTDIPPSKIGGGYMLDYSSSAAAYDATTAGAYGILAKNIMLLGTPLATTASPVKASGILTPTQAMGIDAKMDDGIPNTGGVTAGALGNCIASSLYKITASNKDCVLIFKVANQ